MKPIIRCVALVLAILPALYGCAGQVSVAPVDATFKHVAARHDKYVLADAKLKVVQREAFTNESSTVIKALATARAAGHKTIDADVIRTSAINVCQRHDAYIQADTNLEPLEKETYLFSSVLIQKTLTEAR